MVLRGYLETFVVLCWGIGQLIASGVLQGLQHNNNKISNAWSYRIPFAVQWVWPVMLFPIMCFAPESPWWLVRKGRLLQAEQMVKRLSSTSEDVDARQTVAMMVHTNNLEKEMSSSGSYMSCFKGTDLRRTEISCMAWSIQTWASFVIMGYATYFYE